MIDYALYLYGRPADATKMASVLEQHPGPYRALSAYKGDEERGDRSWPWIVVGASRVNVFGRLWSRDYAKAVADDLNRQRTTQGEG